MARNGWVAKWTAEQKKALISAIFDHGKTTREAVELAAAGLLPLGAPAGKELPAFVIPYPTVADLRQREGRQRRAVERASLAPELVMAETVSELQVMLKREVDRLRTAAAKKVPDLPERIGRLAKAAREVDALTKAVQKSARPAPSTTPAPEETTPAAEPDLLDAIAAEIRA